MTSAYEPRAASEKTSARTRTRPSYWKVTPSGSGVTFSKAPAISRGFCLIASSRPFQSELRILEGALQG